MTDPTICHRDAFYVLGIQDRANPMEVDYAAFWARFEERAAEIRPLAAEPAAYGVYFPTDETGLVEVFGGMAAPAGVDVPEGLVLRQVPAAEYAVFECAIDTIGPTWNTILEEWLPASEYETHPTRAAFEYFRPGCHEGTVPVQIFHPIRKKP